MKTGMTIGVLGASVLLTGCLSVDPKDLMNGNVDTYNSIYDEAVALGWVAPSPLPLGGASYDGGALLSASADGGATHTAMTGDASLTANFDRGTLSGTVDNFVGLANFDWADYAGWSDLAEDAHQGSGTIGLSGDIYSNATMDVAFSGAASVDGTRVAVGGTGDGKLVGPGAEYLWVRGETDNSMAMTVDGAAASGYLYLYAAQN